MSLCFLLTGSSPDVGRGGSLTQIPITYKLNKLKFEFKVYKRLFKNKFMILKIFIKGENFCNLRLP